MRNHAKIEIVFLAFFLAASTLADGCLWISDGNGTDDDAVVTLIPFSGPFGYGFEDGPYGLEGALTKDELTDPNWFFEGDFTFPTTGYTTDAPDVQIAESYPEKVAITLTVHPPAPGTIVAQVLTHAHVTAQIPASNEAVFTLRVVTENGGK